MTDPNDFSEQAEETYISLVTRHQTSILAYLLTLVPSPSDADDILQRANIVLWRKRAQFQIGTNFKAWAFSIARWEALAFLKERKRENWLVFNDEVASLVADRMSSTPDPAVDLYPEALRCCLGRLSAAHRRLILDRYQMGRSLADCARRSGRTENSLKVTLHRIRITLRRCISRRLQSEPA